MTTPLGRLGGKKDDARFIRCKYGWVRVAPRTHSGYWVTANGQRGEVVEAFDLARYVNDLVAERGGENYY